MSGLAAPRAVSPVIRFSRYALLVTGFVYGSWRLSRLTKKEAVLQQEYDKIRAKRDARLAAEKEHAMNEEMAVLGRECGIQSS